MAFGIKGYSYWSYYPVVNSAGEYYVEQTSFVDRMGNPNPTYAIMRKIHAEMRGMEKALMNFTYQGVRTFVNTPIPGDYAYLSGLEKDDFTYVETVEREGEGIILVTELYDEARDQFGYYVVNATAPTAQAEIVATVDFAQVKNVQVYENGEVYNQKLKDGKFSVLLSEGQGLFLLPY